MPAFLRSTRKALARATGLHHVASPEQSQRKATWVKPASPNGEDEDDVEEVVVRARKASPKKDRRQPSGFSGVSRSVDCPFSADDGAETEHQNGPRPVVYKINLRSKRFSCGTGQMTGLT